MVSIISVLMIAVGIFVIEFPSLKRKRYHREIWLFSVLLVLGTGGAIAWTLHVPLPSPFHFLSLVYKPFHDVMMRILS